jgi:peptidoglycan/LPS O-acetylase OafA/YrhL
MTILITNAVSQTYIVIIGIFVALIVSMRRTKDHSFFSLSTTTELKGLAIFMIVFSHVGYFLVSDHRFLVPLSNYAGVGVDLFFLLSGYGLMVSSLKRPLSICQFYLKCLKRIYLPVTISLILFLTLDYFLLHLTYPLKLMAENFFGFFPRADLFNDINSPLWYITPLLFYYLLFPLIFWRRFPTLSAIGMACVGWLSIYYISKFEIVSVDLYKMYRLHFLAFPVGVVVGALANSFQAPFLKCLDKYKNFLTNLHILTALRWLTIILAGFTLYYTQKNSHVGELWTKEMTTSLISVMAILIIFILKKINFKILTLFGIFSFEIYLLHWPLLSRYNFLFSKLPAGMAMIVYLMIFVGLGYLLKKLTNFFNNSKFNLN